MARSTIAVIGASSHRQKFGNKCVRAYLHAGWDVYPVHGYGDTIEGLPVYKKLADVQVDLDRMSVYLPPPVSLDVLSDIAEKGAGEVWFNPGSADRQVFDAADAASSTSGCHRPSFHEPLCAGLARRAGSTHVVVSRPRYFGTTHDHCAERLRPRCLPELRELR